MVLLGLIGLLAAAPGLAGEIAGRASVIDGDTIDIQGQPIRLFGIDAPEAAQPCFKPDGSPWRCGQKAALALQDVIGQAAVRCDAVGRSYERVVATCRVGKIDLSAWLTTQGWAMADPRYGRSYRCHEAEARVARRQIWQGTFIEPWTWRAQR